MQKRTKNHEFCSQFWKSKFWRSVQPAIETLDYAKREPLLKDMRVQSNNVATAKLYECALTSNFY